MLFRTILLVALLVEYYLLAIYYVHTHTFESFIEFAISDPKRFGLRMAIAVALCSTVAVFGALLGALFAGMIRLNEHPYYSQLRRTFGTVSAMYLLYLLAVWFNEVALS
jgi:hypothetical protein